MQFPLIHIDMTKPELVRAANALGTVSGLPSASVDELQASILLAYAKYLLLGNSYDYDERIQAIHTEVVARLEKASLHDKLRFLYLLRDMELPYNDYSPFLIQLDKEEYDLAKDLLKSDEENPWMTDEEFMDLIYEVGNPAMIASHRERIDRILERWHHELFQCCCNVSRARLRITRRLITLCKVVSIEPVKNAEDIFEILALQVLSPGAVVRMDTEKLLATQDFYFNYEADSFVDNYPGAPYVEIRHQEALLKERKPSTLLTRTKALLIALKDYLLDADW